LTIKDAPRERRPGGVTTRFLRVRECRHAQDEHTSQ